jgi:amino acid permease
MACVVLFTTAPILVVCCGEMIEKRYFCSSKEHAPYCRVLSRASICIITTSVSVYVPGFVLIIGVIGCCCVAVTSFILPPLCFILLSWKKDALQLVAVDRTELGRKMPSSMGSFEYFMLVFGILSVFVSSYLTVHHALISK